MEGLARRCRTLPRGREQADGQYADKETGFHYNRHRYYDPQAGRYLTHDPVRLQGGTNLCRYAPNPVGWVDPLGLTCKAYRVMDGVKRNGRWWVSVCPTPY
nr:RHS repeat-associated core domain-containing protein [Massilia frigida]